jgi:hypothetical protein
LEAVHLEKLLCKLHFTGLIETWDGLAQYLLERSAAYVDTPESARLLLLGCTKAFNLELNGHSLDDMPELLRSAAISLAVPPPGAFQEMVKSQADMVLGQLPFVRTTLLNIREDLDMSHGHVFASFRTMTAEVKADMADGNEFMAFLYNFIGLEA